MDNLRLDDDTREVRHRKMRSKRSAGPTLRRHNVACPKGLHRRLVERGDIDSDDAASSDSGLDSGPDSDDEDVPVRPTLTALPTHPSSSTLKVGSGVSALSRTTIGVLQPTTPRFSTVTITSTAQARPTGLGSTLLAAEGDEIDSGIDSGLESDDDLSDDETTTPAPLATGATATGETTRVTSSVGQPTTTQSTAMLSAPASSSSSSSDTANKRPSITESVTSSPTVTLTPVSTPSLPESQLAPTQTTTASGNVGMTPPAQVLGSVVSGEHQDMSPGQVTGIVIGVLGMFVSPQLQLPMLTWNNQPASSS